MTSPSTKHRGSRAVETSPKSLASKPVVAPALPAPLTNESPPGSGVRPVLYVPFTPLPPIDYTEGVNMEFTLRPARRGKIWGRLLFFGESGSGKTYGALALAHHLAKLYGIPVSKIAVLDTETVESADRKDGGTGSAEKYADRPCNCNRCLRQGLTIGGFQVMLMEDGSRGPESFCRALEVCKQAGIEIVVLDGITDEWRALLQIVDKINAQTRGKGDGWSTARPLHNQFVRALMEYPGHVISTCRAKKESRHKKAEDGLGDVMPDQDGNVIYEYDVAVFCKRGTGYVVKTRDDRLENVSSQHLGADLAEAVKRWCDDPKAEKNSATAAFSEVAPPAQAIPQTAPNTRTDVAEDTSAECAEVERLCVALKEVGATDIADKSWAHMQSVSGSKSSLLKLIDRQRVLLGEAQELAALKAAEANPPAESDESKATEGFDLPF